MKDTDMMVCVDRALVVLVVGRYVLKLHVCLFDCLVGLVVKVSASRAEGPGFESRLRQDFFGVES